MARLAALSFALLTLCTVRISSADTISTNDGQNFQGKVEKLEKDVFTLRLPNGEAQVFRRDQVKGIVIDHPDPKDDKTPNLLKSLSKPPKKYGTPTDTFQRWRQAAVVGDINRIVDCYASFRQKEVRDQLKKLSKEDLEKMRNATAATRFIPSPPIYQGDRAVMEVNWQKGLNGDSQSLQFVLEKNDWKLVQ